IPLTTDSDRQTMFARAKTSRDDPRCDVMNPVVSVDMVERCGRRFPVNQTIHCAAIGAHTICEADNSPLENGLELHAGLVADEQCRGERPVGNCFGSPPRLAL